MSDPASELFHQSGARLRSLLWPREHGAWGILLVPLVSGASIGLMQGKRLVPVLWLLLGSLALFCLRTPLEAALGTSALRAQSMAERQAVLAAIAAYAAVAGASLVALFWGGGNRGLLALGGPAALAFGAQALLRRLGRETRMVSQMAGSIGLTSTAAAAYYVSTGQLDARALLLWAANWLFAANQIQFVQLRIRAARTATLAEKLSRGWAFLLGQGLTVLAVVLAGHNSLLPGFALLAFGPVLLRGVLWFFQPAARLQVHRLGASELLHAMVFGVLFILSFHIG